jgi:hypothetical protein
MAERIILGQVPEGMIVYDYDLDSYLLLQFLTLHQVLDFDNFEAVVNFFFSSKL